MSDRKSLGRLAFARSEGIYRRVDDGFANKVECLLCGLVMASTPLATASHGKKHLRAGDVVAKTEFTDDGPRTTYHKTPVCECIGCTHDTRCVR